MALFDVAFFFVAFIIMAVSYYFLFGGKKTSMKQQPQQQVLEVQQQEQRRPLVRRQVESDSEDENDEQNQVQDAEKQAKREAKKQRNQERNDYLKQQFEAKQKKDDERRKKDDEIQKQREEEERKQEEWKKKIEEDQKQKEAEEYEKWKNMFQVEAAGEEKLSEEEETRRLREQLNKFCCYIQEQLRKVVQLEDLSSEFKMSTKEVIDKIKSLELNEQLRGLIDDRGKYICLTQQELDSVKGFILAKGKVTRQELLKECNSLIRLDPSAKDKEKIAEEEKLLLQEVQKEMEQDE